MTAGLTEPLGLGARWFGNAAAALGAWSVGWALVVACSSAPPPKPRPKPVVEEVPDPQSAEWLYATKGVGSADLGKECQHVRRIVADEAQCAGEACVYASRLSADWIRRCRKALPASLDEVSQLAREYANRKAGARLPCMRDIDQILSEGCGDDPACGEAAQAWVTRCSDVARSPLVVRILETRLEQAKQGPRRATLDKRGCRELSAAVLSRAKCAQKFQCQDGLTAVDTYRKRCLGPGTLPSLSEGLAELSVRVGAAEAPKPLAIAPDSLPLEPASFSVPLADGSGIALQVCGQRAQDLGAYLALRRECSDGEVVMVRRHVGRSAKDGATLRVGRLLHPSDEAFSRLYPSLKVEGEMAARTLAGLARLNAELAALAASAAKQTSYHPALGAELIRVLAKEASVLRSSVAATGLAERDAELVPLFKNLAGAKREAAKALLKPPEHAGFLRRALKRPLADVAADGNVSVAALNAAAALELGALLPKASAAYQAELSQFAQRIGQKALTRKQQQALQATLAEASSACNAAQTKVRANEVDLRECAFSVVCEDELLSELQVELRRAHVASAQGRLRALLARDSMDGNVASPGGDAGCPEPWW